MKFNVFVDAQLYLYMEFSVSDIIIFTEVV